MKRRLFALSLLIMMILTPVVFLAITETNNSIVVHAEDSESNSESSENIQLPKGYIDPYTFYIRGSKEEKPVFNGSYAYVQGSYVTVHRVSQNTFSSMCSLHTFEVEQDAYGDFTWDCSGVPVTWEVGQKNGAITITASQHMSGKGRKTENYDDSHLSFTADYSLHLEIYNAQYTNGKEIWEQGDMYFDVKGTESASYTRKNNKTGETTSDSATRTINQKEVTGNLLRGKYHQLSNYEDTATYPGDTYWYYYLDNGSSETNPMYKVANQSSIFVELRVLGIKPKKGVVIEGYSSTAWDDAGEVAVSVPAAIVIGLIAGGVAIAAAAGAAGGVGSSSGDGTDADKNKKSYKMYVQKDFGSALRRGDEKPAVIRARMVEINELGKEIERNDLTEKITVSSQGMTIHETKVVGKYLEAKVSVPKEYQEDKASITFTFTGEGGMFNNEIIFRVVDGALIQFIKVGDEPGSNNENCGLNMIMGDGFTYDATFKVIDATTPPTLKDISTVNPGNFEVEFEATEEPSTFKIKVKNNTVDDKDENVLCEPKQEQFEIRVNVEGEKEPLKGFIKIKLYKEGITAECSDTKSKGQDKYVEIQAYENETAGDNQWKSAFIYLNFAIKCKDKAIINPKDAEYQIEKLKDQDGKGSTLEIERSLAEKYKYDKDFDTKNYERPLCVFTPKANLVEPEDGQYYLVGLPVKGTHEGKSYESVIPLVLHGKDRGPMEEWNKEYAKLKFIVEKYSIPENKAKWLAKLEDIVKDPKPTAEHLRLLSKYIIREYMRYWTVEGIKNFNDAVMYDNIVSQLEWVKFVGDCAFSYVVQAYAGPVADALISPAKDFFANYVGEIVACAVRGKSVRYEDLEMSKYVSAAAENILANNISFTNWKEAAGTLGIYFAYA